MNPTTDAVSPEKDPLTGYHTLDFFKNHTLPHYIGLSQRAESPFGVVLLEFDKQEYQGLASDTERDALITMAKEHIGRHNSFDERAREGNRIYLLLREANPAACRVAEVFVRTDFSSNSFLKFRLAVGSFAPAVEPITSDSIMTSLEDAL